MTKASVLVGIAIGLVIGLSMDYILPLQIASTQSEVQTRQFKSQVKGGGVASKSSSNIHGIPKQKNDTNDLAAFVHVGKTGGSSARCVLRTELREDQCRSGPTSARFADDALGEGSNLAIREKTVASLHMRGVHLAPGFRPRFPKKEDDGDRFASRFVRENFRTVIVSTRNPVERMISWFLYTVRFKKHEGLDAVLFGPKCNYKSIDAFFSDLPTGLSNDTTNNNDGSCSEPLNYYYYDYYYSSSSDKNDDGDVVINNSGNKECCRSAAMRCVVGEANCGGHNIFNYTYYLKGLLGDDDARPDADPPPPPPIERLFVVRNEFKWDDVERINLMMGGDGASFSAKALGAAVSLRKSPGDRAIGNSSRANLCALLCEDLHYYAKAIHRAENLHRLDKAITLRELKGSCGDIDVSTLCPAYDFPVGT